MIGKTAVRMLVTVAVAATSLALAPLAGATHVFTDVDDSAFYANDVTELVSRNITQGTTPTTYEPDLVIDRSQMVTFLYRYSGSPSGVPGDTPFGDVPTETFFTRPVAWAFFNGITQGVTSSEFAPNDIVTRGQMVTFLWRCAGTPSVSDPANFPDVNDSDFYAAAVRWAKKTGVTLGKPDGTFGPSEFVTRGQMAAFLVRTGNELGWAPCAESFVPDDTSQPIPITPGGDNPDAVPGQVVLELINAGSREVQFLMAGPTAVDASLDPCVDTTRTQCPNYAPGEIVPPEACDSTPTRTIDRTVVTINPGTYQVFINVTDQGETVLPLTEEWTNLLAGVVYEFCVILRESPPT